MIRSKNLLLLVCMLLGLSAFAKDKQKHGTWYYDYKKLDGSTYEINFHLSLEDGWYVCAEEDDKKGIKPPSFTFEKNGGTYTFDGGITPKGILETKPIRRHGLVNTYSLNAIFSQRIFARPDTKVRGSFSYQLFTSGHVQKQETEKFEIIVK